MNAKAKAAWRAQGAPVGNNNRAIQRGNESQKPCLFEKTAEKIAAVAGVSPRTIKNADILTDNLSVRTDSYAADAALPNPAFFSRYVVSAP